MGGDVAGGDGEVAPGEAENRSMSRDLKRLLVDAQQAESDALLTLAEVEALTGTPLLTLRRWVYREDKLPHLHVGPTRRTRVRLSVVIQFFDL